VTTASRVVGALLASWLLLTLGPATGAERESPRAAIRGFLDAARADDWQQAATLLDLSAIPPARRDTQGPRLARELSIVLERTLRLDPDALSDDPAGDRDDGLAREVERLGVVHAAAGTVDVLLRRSPDEVWKIGPRTVAAVPALYAEFGSGTIESVLPRPLVEIRPLGLALWQWIALLLLAVGAWAAAWAAVAGLGRVARRFAARSATPVDDTLVPALSGPARAGVGLAVFTAGTLLLALPLPALLLLTTLEKAAVVLVMAWATLRVVDVFAAAVAARLAARGQTAALAMMPIGSKALKVVVLLFAVLATLQNVGVNVTGLLAGLGIGGLALALAAQKTVENLFGGVSVILDQPVRVGDFCRFGSRIGTVEEVGLRSTRVRTLDRTVVSIPNAEFSSLQLENFSRRDRIWLHATLGLRYETTPDQLRHVLGEIQRLLRDDPRVDPDPARIRFVGFGAYSLDCEIFAYVRTEDYGEFLAIREDVFLGIMDVVAASGTSFAFPSQTLYVGSDAGLDQAKSRAAERQGQAWRPTAARTVDHSEPRGRT
jgi:MscS family membrane protein